MKISRQPTWFNAGVLLLILGLLCWQPTSASADDELLQELTALREEVKKRNEKLRGQLRVIQQQEEALAQRKEKLESAAKRKSKEASKMRRSSKI